MLPTRILDVRGGSDDGFVKVIEPEGIRDRYVALATIGDLHIEPLLRKATLQAHKRWVLLSDLPQTFKDAVHVVRSIGVRYLWIDSLCIIQDDFDWERESSNMALFMQSHI